MGRSSVDGGEIPAPSILVIPALRRRPLQHPSTAPASERGPAPCQASYRPPCCRRYLVNRDLSEQPGLCRSGSPLGGGGWKLSYSTASAPSRVSGWVQHDCWCEARRDTPVRAGGRLRGKRGYDGRWGARVSRCDHSLQNRGRPFACSCGGVQLCSTDDDPNASSTPADTQQTQPETQQAPAPAVTNSDWQRNCGSRSPGVYGTAAHPLLCWADQVGGKLGGDTDPWGTSWVTFTDCTSARSLLSVRSLIGDGQPGACYP